MRRSLTFADEPTGGTLPISRGSAGRLMDRLRDRIRRLESSARFQRWAAAFPLTRPIARRRAAALFDLCAGFVYSQILQACVTTGLFRHLADGPLTLAVLSQRLALPMDGTERLLRGATALRLVERRGDGRYALGPLGAPILGNPGIAAMVTHHAMLYADLADPVARLRDRSLPSTLGAYWPYARDGAPESVPSDRVAAYTALMAASQPMVADEVLAAYPFARHRRILDVGGGDGTFLTAVAERFPHLALTLFDLPAVAERARVRIAAAGHGDRAACIGGDMFADPLPDGADLVTLVRVLHDHDDARVASLLRAVHAALVPGGVILVAEPMAEVAGAARMGDAYFGFYLLAMGSGRPRTADALTSMLHEAGFRRVRRIRTNTPLVTSLLAAEAGK